MHYYYLERSHQLTCCLAISKKGKLLPLRECKVGYQLILRRGEISSIRKVGRGLSHNRNEL